MTITDFLPLVEKIRKRISSWTGRFLSYAGRLQLINSVIRSLTNFWMTAFRLPSGCIEEIERICAAFLWSGPDLNGRKAKISWEEVCRSKQEGGLGLRPLKEVNLVCCLKLVWRILSASSLWVNWIKMYLIRKGSFWTIKENTQCGSWMWKKILKCRERAKEFYGVEIRDGRSTSFWHEKWSSLGCLTDVARDGGCIDMGLQINATVADCMNHRRRYHRVQLFNRIEVEIAKFKEGWSQEEDISVWKNGKGKYKKAFSTKETWLCIREKHLLCHLHHAVWFKHATPKYSFVTWLAMRGRLSTGERMLKWNGNVNASCVFCQDPLETSKHLFFECSYSAQIWETLMKGVIKHQYIANWDDLVNLIAGDLGWSKTKLFIARYIFQSSVHTIWRERNRRRHGEASVPAVVLIKRLDKNMRNQFTVIRRRGGKEYEDGMAIWFDTR